MNTNENNEKIQIELMKILTRNVGVFKNQYDLYSELYENMEIKTPDKEDFKLKFLATLRILPSIYDNVFVKNSNNTLSASFSPDDDSFNESFEQVSNKPINNDDFMPNELAVIQFIIDNKLVQFYMQKDYLGNTILHYLIAHNDIDRIEKIKKVYELSLLDKNNDGFTPIDLITNIETSRFVIKELMEVNIKNKEELSDIKIDLKILGIRLNSVTTHINLFFYIIQLIIIFYIFYSIFG
jgi:hypothetical protein